MDKHNLNRGLDKFHSTRKRKQRSLPRRKLNNDFVSNREKKFSTRLSFKDWSSEINKRRGKKIEPSQRREKIQPRLGHGSSINKRFPTINELARNVRIRIEALTRIRKLARLTLQKIRTS